MTRDELEKAKIPLTHDDKIHGILLKYRDAQGKIQEVRIKHNETYSYFHPMEQTK